MPRGDGTGPAGLGPMTGRAAGYCAGYAMGSANSMTGRGRGFGVGRRLCRGDAWARGFGRGWPRYGRGDPYAPQPLSPQQEADVLKGQAKAIQDELNMINARIQGLESGPQA